MQNVDETRYDVGLLERVIAREADAIGELYDRHSRLLFGLILRILGDRGEAEEVLQDVFLQVWTRAQTFNVELGTPIAWIVRIARNRAIDRLARTSCADAAACGAPAAGVTDDPEAHAALTEQQRAVSRALDTLPAEARQLLEHAYFLGLTQSELAERFELPLGTVKTRIERPCGRSGASSSRRRSKRPGIPAMTSTSTISNCPWPSSRPPALPRRGHEGATGSWPGSAPRRRRPPRGSPSPGRARGQLGAAPGAGHPHEGAGHELERGYATLLLDVAPGASASLPIITRAPRSVT